MATPLQDGNVSEAKNPQGERQFKTITVQPWKRWDIILATLTLNVLSLFLPMTILQLYDRIIPNQATYTLGILSIAIAIATLFEMLLRMARSRILAWLGVEFEHSTAMGAFGHLMSAEVEQMNKKGAGQHIENLDGVGVVKEFMAGQGFLVLLDLPFVLVYFALIWYFAGNIVYAPIVVLVFFVMASLWMGGKLREVLEKRLDVDDRRYNFIIELFNNHHTLKALGMEHLLLRRFERIQSQCSANEYKVNLYSAEARDMGGNFSFLMFVAIVGFAAMKVVHGQLSVGMMAACIVLTNRLMQPIQAAMGMWTRIQHLQIARRRLTEIEHMPLEERNYQGHKTDLHGQITIEGLKYSYGPGLPNVLDGIDLHVRPGSAVTILGKNGAGKTTLTLLLMGTLKPTEGAILYDGHPLHYYQMHALRTQMAYLPPQGVLFHGTIRDNMTMFKGGSVADEAYELATQVGLDQWISRLPQGYDTMVGDNHFSLLPAGIQQRLCLVRAIVHKPKVLILDEANTSLDHEGDHMLKKSLQNLKGKTTIIFVTHRPSINQIADDAYELIDGKLYARPLDAYQTPIQGDMPNHFASAAGGLQ